MRQKKVKALKKAGLWPVRMKWDRRTLPVCSRVKVKRAEKFWNGKKVIVYSYRFPRHAKPRFGTHYNWRIA
jgi:hypothetical protein